MITRNEYERREIEALRSRRRFLDALARAPEVALAYQAWQVTEREAFEARRDRRESEIVEGSG